MLDKKYDFKEKEEKWSNYWEQNDIYKFIPDQREVYSIDTPPPTVSGKIHIGHLFSFSQAEMIARYKRLSGYNVFYPFGFDDNGLPTERLVEKELGIKAHNVGREDFQKQCYELSDKYENEFKSLFKKIGMSADINNAYKTVSNSTIKISQRSFLELVEKGNAYHKESPALWCNECQTSIAQAELETKTIDTTFNYINFNTDENETFTIATTRPELIPAIIAVFVNPNDIKHSHLIGKNAIIPILDIKVPILADDKVGIDKGTGVVMCCTFGDQTDIEWWKKYNLPLKNIFTPYGTISDEVEKYAGLKIKDARKKIIEDFDEAGYLVKIEPLTHEVQTHERCGKEIEYTVIKQWFIDIMNHKDDFLKIGEQVNWYPEHMHARYKEWVSNIMWDWCISRQRFFGVPFPVWYCKECGTPLLGDIKDLPINPLVDKPSKMCECGCKEYIPETDVMDTWATSSVTPLINMKYGEKDNYEELLKPMSLRCNAHDIIRTWDFYTIVKSYYHFTSKPWENVMVSGFVMADKGEKISKSKSNAKMDPFNLLNEYGADIARYWAASGKLGTDIIFTEDTLTRGRKFINKFYNMASFVNMHLEDYNFDESDIQLEYIDKYILEKYKNVEEQYKKYLDNYEVGLALNTLEKFFWNFCDNYIEIVKHRLYRPEEFNDGARLSGQKTIYTLLYKLIQDFSIFFPFITEELYHSIYEGKSIHLTTFKSLETDYKNEEKFGDIIIDIISEARGYKTNANVSLKTEVSLLDISVNNELYEAINECILDFKATLNIKELKINKDSSIKSYDINKLDLDIKEA